MDTCRRPSCRLSIVGAPPQVMGRVHRINFDPPQLSKSEQLLARLLARALKTFPETHYRRPLVRAAREAAKLAERAGYAILLLPELFAELAIAEMLKAEYLRMGRI